MFYDSQTSPELFLIIFENINFSSFFMIFEKRDRVTIDPVKLEKPHENHIKLH